MAALPREIKDEEVLTQYGQAEPGTMGGPIFHTVPRDKDRDALSLILGEVSADEACQIVQKGRPLSLLGLVRFPRVPGKSRKPREA
jgi:hypothetical protein